MYNSLREKRAVTLESLDTFVDGASMKKTGPIPFVVLDLKIGNLEGAECEDRTGAGRPGGDSDDRDVRFPGDSGLASWSAFDSGFRNRKRRDQGQERGLCPQRVE